MKTLFHRLIRMNALASGMIAALCASSLAPGFASAQAVPVYLDRVSRIVYDFDANGMTDATDVISYDVQGRPESAAYVYTDDGTTDLLNTRDNGTTTEDASFVFNGDNLLTFASVDRGFERFETTQTFTGSQLTRVDFGEFDNMGAPVNESFATFSYTPGGDLTLVENRDSGAGMPLIASIGLTYGGNGLPATYDLSSTGVSIDHVLTWRSDGQPNTISSTAFGAATGTGLATYGYDAQDRPLSEVWMQTGFVGSFLSEFPGFDYRKTFFYDGLDRRTREEIDLNDDGSVDAVITYEWERETCVPSFVWAPNGQPNFVASPYLPFVPGTGVRKIQYCPEPSFALALALGLGGLALTSTRRRKLKRTQNRN